MPSTFDVIVLGVGGMGSAACFELAKRGRRVLGIEQFSLLHALGSSHGQTRIIRSAYFEGPDYVPILRRAWERWYDLEQRVGRRLLTECGCLNLGPKDGEVVVGAGLAAERYSLNVDFLDERELRTRFPPFAMPEGYRGVFESKAGFLDVEDCVRAHIEAARERGATIVDQEPVQRWNAEGSGVVVETTRSTYRAANLVITAGSWAGPLLGPSGATLRVLRQTPHWFKTADDSLFRRDRFPVFIAEMPEGYFYGFPVIDSHGLKVARHYGAPELLAPDEVDRDTYPADETLIRDFLNHHLPAVNGPVVRAEVCLYTPTPDRHFLIDVHPAHPNVCFAAGFSGHGFKFASVVGEILADLVAEGRTKWPIELFRASRFR
jgi:sarcosine oxidase